MVDGYRTKRLKAGFKPSTVNRDVTMLHSAFTHAVGREIVESNPVQKLRPLREAGGRLRFLDEGAVKRLRAKLAKPTKKRQPKWLRPMVLLALNTGMRLSECTKLQWRDIDFTNNVVTVAGTHAKNTKTRHIPLNEEASNALIGWFNAYATSTDRVFPGRLGGGVMLNITVPLRTLMRDANIEGASFHTLRHTFASRLMQRGVNISTVQELMGHADLRMTTLYSHLASGAGAAAVALL